MTEPPLATTPPGTALLERGYDSRDAGDSAGAERWFREAAAAAPRDAEPRGALGDLLLETGRTAEAVMALRHADALEPGQPHRLAALAEAQAADGDDSGAAETCERWLAIRPGSVSARIGLAESLVRLGRREAAAGHLDQAVSLDPSDPTAAMGLAGLLTDLGDPLAALERVQPALRHRPDHGGLHFQIGRAWLALGESAKAAAAWRTSLDLDPGDDWGAADALARAESAAPSAAPPDPTYVRALFDRYAERFDDDLGRLGYRAPQVLLEAVGTRPSGGRGLDILDLGCGTGLAGVAFAPLARHLAGVDLSPRMVERARRRGLYHTLYTGDLIETLRAEAARWDLIVAADVFNYLGDLGPVMAALAEALRPGGKAAATVEAADDDAGYQVSETRRVRHGAAHVRAACEAAGLIVASLTSAVLRTEGGRPVSGLVFAVERPPTAPSAVPGAPAPG